MKTHARRSALAVGVDTGGTFTDLVAIDDAGRLRVHKLLSTPRVPERAVLAGLRRLAGNRPLRVVTYGSTVATNALLERRGARVALVTTAGMEDVIEIGRQSRPELYALEPRRPDPLVPRARRLGVEERLSHAGEVVRPLTRTALAALLRRLRRLRPEAVAIALLHSYANPRHERRLAAALARLQVPLSVSHLLGREYREYERTSTTVINAYVSPPMARHLARLRGTLRGVRLRVMQSNGGAVAASRVEAEAVRTILSGPAGGVVGAWAVGEAAGLRRLITFDMGGTSTDVCLVDGVPPRRPEWAIGGLPVRIPVIDIHTVGAGGGSLARRDAGGVLKIGPESAGADPGPACYGRGRRPTVTDAHVVLGRLPADRFLGGTTRIDRQRAEAVIAALARQIRLSPLETAAGIVRVANAVMERAVRVISVERGIDPRPFTLMAFGGAAALHVCELAAGLGIARVLVPRHAGLLSAWGMLRAEVVRDYALTVRCPPLPLRLLRARLAPLVARAQEDLALEGLPRRERTFISTVEVRYVGQSYELAVPLGAEYVAAFHALHARQYGYADPERPVEVVTLRLLAVGTTPPIRPRRLAPMRPHPAKPDGEVTVFLDDPPRRRRVPLLLREGLRPGARFAGPAVVSEYSATTCVPPGWRGSVDSFGNIGLKSVKGEA